MPHLGGQGTLYRQLRETEIAWGMEGIQHVLILY